MDVSSLNSPQDFALTATPVPKRCRFNPEVKVEFNFERIQLIILALICFNYWASKSCEIFDGTRVVMSPFESAYTHENGGLALYENNPSTVGCWAKKHKKAESLSPIGWVALPDFPK